MNFEVTPEFEKALKREIAGQARNDNTSFLEAPFIHSSSKCNFSQK
jgi:hypothetical protein